ncbi:hypothetical protein BD779DRAFT_1475348, partial [Infundibulicybe gibba]
YYPYANAGRQHPRPLTPPIPVGDDILSGAGSPVHASHPRMGDKPARDKTAHPHATTRYTRAQQDGASALLTGDRVQGTRRRLSRGTPPPLQWADYPAHNTAYHHNLSNVCVDTIDNSDVYVDTVDFSNYHRPIDTVVYIDHFAFNQCTKGFEQTSTDCRRMQPRLELGGAAIEELEEGISRNDNVVRPCIAIQLLGDCANGAAEYVASSFNSGIHWVTCGGRACQSHFRGHVLDFA